MLFSRSGFFSRMAPELFGSGEPAEIVQEIKLRSKGKR